MTATETVVAPKERILTKADRCDGCGPSSRAVVRVSGENLGTWQFCGHHWARHEAALREQDVLTEVIDEREFIDQE